jgi:hypothetical protein
VRQPQRSRGRPASLQSIIRKSAWMLVPALCASSPAPAEIFKCPGKNGADVYQNFPCEIATLGSLPSGPSTARATVAPDTAASVASVSKVVNAGDPRVGMTQGEVRTAWGEPVETFEDELISGRIEVWRYGDNRSVQFDRKHRVLAVQR